MDHIHVQTVPMTNSIRTPYTFYIFWIFGIFTDDCLDSNFIHFRQTNINLVTFNQSIWITSMSKLSPWPIQSLPPYTFYIVWIICIFTDDCLSIIRRSIISKGFFCLFFGHLMILHQKMDYPLICPNCHHGQFNPCLLTCNFLICQGLVKILILKEYFYFSKIPNYH